VKENLIFMFLLCALGCFLCTPAFAKVLIIANNSVSQESIDKKDVQKIFLGKMVRWPDNSSIYFGTCKTDAHQEFLRVYLKRSSSQFRNYWRKMVFTGKGHKPKAFQTDEEFVQFVSKTKGAIGYVSAEAELKNVKTINVN